MHIKTKFNIFDTLVTVDKSPVEKECDTCSGTGEVKLKGKKFDCPDCNGRGASWDYKNYRCSVGEALRVDRIEVWVNQDGTTEEFYKNDTGNPDRDWKLITSPNFKTFTEAEDYCKKQNVKLEPKK